MHLHSTFVLKFFTYNTTLKKQSLILIKHLRSIQRIQNIFPCESASIRSWFRPLQFKLHLLHR